MKKIISLILTAILFSTLLLSSAAAEEITMTGTVVSTHTETITASLGGTVGQVMVSAGDHVEQGDPLVILTAEKVYALQDGTVRVFGEVSDSTDMLVDRYGAVVYVEPACEYVISASTKNAYEAEENKVIHPGETVWLKSVENMKNVGTGMVTSVSGSSYSLEVTGGSFSADESVYIFRDKNYAANSRIGRGTVSRQSPVAYSGSGIVADFSVVSGKKVKKGDVLFETLSGSYQNASGDLKSITAGSSGVIASISLNKGSSLSAGETVAEFYADSDLRIQATVSEADLQYINPGDSVTATFIYLDEGEYTVAGVIEKISRTSTSVDEETNEASYTVLIKPESTERLCYGMNAVIEKK